MTAPSFTRRPAGPAPVHTDPNTLTAPSVVRRLSGPAPARTDLAPALHLEDDEVDSLSVDRVAEATPHITSVEAPATRPTAPVSGALVAPAMSTLHSQVALTKPQATALAKRIQSMPPVTLLSHLEAAERLADALDAFKSRE